MSWKELRFPLSDLDADQVEATLDELGALAVTFEDAADEALLEPAPGEQPLWTQSGVRALFDAAADLDAVAGALWARLDVPAPDWQVARIEDRQWETAWREDFRPMQFGARLWVCPSGQTVPNADAVVIRLDPGLAFGTGTHPTTALCLEWLERRELAGATVIDYGCGSGILAIAAARLGAAHVYAVDYDPQALIATRDNAAANGVGAQISALLPDALPPLQADVLVANILARPLLALAEEFAAHVCEGGALALAGILATQRDTLRMKYAQWFAMNSGILRQEWALLEGTRRPR